MSTAHVFFAGLAAFVFAIAFGASAPNTPGTSGEPALCCAPSAEALADDASPLDRIKALAGTWVSVDEEGAATDQVVSIYRVTGGGTAVIETIFPGQEMEMITLYHLDGTDLVLTHYCMLGNQPSMTAKTITDDQIVFTCNDDGTFKSGHDEAHMHQGTIDFLGKNRIKTQWREIENGEVIYTAGFEVVRRK